MSNEDLKEKTKRFAVEIIKFVETLPKNQITNVIGRQILRSGTSVGANYRSACRARSRADFISKMGIVEEESDETLYWLELLLVTGVVKYNQVECLMNEANDIIAMVVKSIKTARKSGR